MKAFNGYAETKALGSGSSRLPVGGYVLKILDVKYVQGGNGTNDRIILSYDVEEGDQKGFYKKNFDSQQGEDKKWKGATQLWVPADDGTESDEWTKRKFKTMTTAVEDSNPNYHWGWDESTLKGKLVGGVFNDKEWALDGRTGFYTALHHFCAVDVIRSGDFKTPDPTYLKNKPAAPMPENFVSVKETDKEELPFD